MEFNLAFKGLNTLQFCLKMDTTNTLHKQPYKLLNTSRA